MGMNRLCRFCGQDILAPKTKGCNPVPLTRRGEEWVFPERYSPNTETRCVECNVVPREHHHPGCPLTICPDCGGLLVQCSCFSDK
jgi:hypothetical protein